MPGPLTNGANADNSQGIRIRQWLLKAGLIRYYDRFSAITEAQFGGLMMQDYAKYGVVDMADKQKLFRLIKTLNTDKQFGSGVDKVAAPAPAPVPAKVANPASATARPDSTELRPKTPQSAGFTMPDESIGLSPLMSPMDEDLLSEAHGLAGDILDVNDECHDLLGAGGVAPRTRVNSSGGLLSTSPLDQLHRLSQQQQQQGPSAAAAAAQAASAAISAAASPVAPVDPLADVPRIRVVVRKRPLNRREIAKAEEDIVTMKRPEADEPSQLVVWEPRTKVDLTKYTERHEFAFDDVFPVEVDNDEVYNTTVHPLIPTIFDRCKVTCFAYGQTGSGKTYTMSPLPTRAAGEVLAELAKPRNADLVLWVSFFEIYGGKVFDLLNGRKKLVIREDARSQMCVVGLQEFEVDNVELVQQLIEHGTAARCTGATGANSESSRSHAILQLALKKREEEPDASVPASVAAQRAAADKGANHAVIHGKFSFIDLAGSERGADTTDNDRQTRLEGAEINKSLLALKECIRALDMGANHVPFRGSKLTEVLRDSFMGNSRTVMIANISPATGSCEHTLNTLRYAYRVKELRSEGGGKSRGRPTTSSSGVALAADGVTPLTRTDSGQEKEIKEATAAAVSTRAESASQRASGYSSARGGRDSSEPAVDPRTMAFKPGKPTAAAKPTNGGVEQSRGGSGVPRSASSRSVAAAAEEEPTQPSQSLRVERERLTGAGKRGVDVRRSANSRVAAAWAPEAGGGSTTPRGTQRGSGRPSTAPAREPARDAPPVEPGRDSPPRVGAGQTRQPPAGSRPKVVTAPPQAAASAPGAGAGAAALDVTSPSAMAAAKALAAAAGTGPPVDMTEMVSAHDELINVILEEEEEVVASHRQQIEATMELVKREMALLADVDKPGSAIDVYVERLAGVLDQKAQSIAALQARVAKFQAHLKEEEVLSRTVGLH